MGFAMWRFNLKPLNGDIILGGYDWGAGVTQYPCPIQLTVLE